MKSFTYQTLPTRVIFGSGSIAELANEVQRMSLSRVLVLSKPGQADLAGDIVQRLGDKTVGIFDGAAMHTPQAITDQAMTMVTELNVDGLIAVGGGSTTGLGKAIAYRTDLPQIVLPTTYAGSEMTPVVGETVAGKKRTMSSPRILPECVIYDVDLTLALRPAIASVSGLNAIAHAVEALYARDRNPITSLMALEGIAALTRALPIIKNDPAHRAARAEALYGAWLCGVCLGTVGMALHHKLCHTLGGSFNLPHAETHAVILPHALAYNLPYIDDAERLAKAFGADDAVTGLVELSRKLGVPASLGELGMPAAAVKQAAEIAMSNAYWNPRPLEHAAIEMLLARAQRGDAPHIDR